MDVCLGHQAVHAARHVHRQRDAWRRQLCDQPHLQRHLCAEVAPGEPCRGRNWTPCSRTPRYWRTNDERNGARIAPKTASPRRSSAGAAGTRSRHPHRHAMDRTGCGCWRSWAWVSGSPPWGFCPSPIPTVKAARAAARAEEQAADQAEKAQARAGSAAPTCASTPCAPRAVPEQGRRLHARPLAQARRLQRLAALAGVWQGRPDERLRRHDPHKYMCVVGLSGGTMIDFAVVPE